MASQLISWDIYEIHAKTTSLNGVMLRGRIRKLCLNLKQNVLVENTTDYSNGVRFAVLHTEDTSAIIAYVKSLGEDITVLKIADAVQNPVLSKLQVNVDSRYTL